MKIAVVSRIYNEECIIAEFLNHYREITTGGFYFYDDGSTDNTLSVLKSNTNVKHIIEGERHSTIASHTNQNKQRQQILQVALDNLDENDYILLLDADEFIYFNSDAFDGKYDIGKCPLFDLYITKNDLQSHWTERKYVGPEVRDIIFMVRVGSYKTLLHDRTIVPIPNSISKFIGFVKHVGKGISVEYWERKCNHYANSNMPEKYSKKWNNRKGKAIHEMSDFNRTLYKWDYIIENKQKWIKID